MEVKRENNDPRTCPERMGSVLYCLLRNCFEDDDDNNSERTSTHNGIYQETRFVPPRLMSVSRQRNPTGPLRANSQRAYQIVGEDAEADCGNENFIHENRSNTTHDDSTPRTENETILAPEPNPLILFLRQLGNRRHAAVEENRENNQNHHSNHSTSGNSLDGEILHTGGDGEDGLSLIPPSSTPLVQDGDSSLLKHTEEESKRLLEAPKSPLRVASTFHCRDETHEVPSIELDEVVLPGSELQREMSINMKKTLETQEDECVICMEVFDATNPRMPTLCGCGENKTYFHLPCLYQWIDQDRNCPSCRKRLRWEEY